LKELDLIRRPFSHYGVKETVFPFNMFPEVVPVLGPEIRSAGEVLGLANCYSMAFYKAQEATNASIATTSPQSPRPRGSPPAARGKRRLRAFRITMPG
jgi:carbamoylphosphate synthase large subunit